MFHQIKLNLLALSLAFCVAALGQLGADTCRVGSERLKLYTKKSIEKLLDADALQSIYWPEEYLNIQALSKTTGMNITSAETWFSLDDGLSAQTNADGSSKADVEQPSLVNDMFVTCSADIDRSYTLTINIELRNPFKVIGMRFKQPRKGDDQEDSSFQVRLSQSYFLIQLNQRIRYDDCLNINYVQLSPNVNYEVQCISCDPEERSYLERIFSKRMSQLDAELDLMLSEKLSMGLQSLLDQQRLDLDLYLN